MEPTQNVACIRDVAKSDRLRSQEGFSLHPLVTPSRHRLVDRLRAQAEHRGDADVAADAGREPGEGQAPGRRGRGAHHGAPELFDKLSTLKDALIPLVGLAAAAQDGHGEPATRTPQQFAGGGASRATKSTRSASSRKIGRRSHPRTIT